MLLVDALYVNNSGGKVLLDYLIYKLVEQKVEVFFLLDKRCESSYLDLNLKNVTFVEATLKNRKKFYKNDNKKFTHIFCFANLAPPVKCGGQVVTYFHNLLLSEIPVGTPLKKKLVLLLKRYLAKRISKNSDLFLVQTEYAKESFSKVYGGTRVEVVPFYNDFDLNAGEKKKNTFLYVSDGNPHKNHKVLLDAWVKLNDTEAQLWLTVSSTYPDLQEQIAQLIRQGYNIINHTNLTRVELNELYAKAEYLIYPSLLESFGLGLIEGAIASCKIIASNLPYVGQVVVPSKVFDPFSAVSIESCVRDVIDNQFLPPTSLKAQNEILKLIEIISKKI